MKEEEAHTLARGVARQDDVLACAIVTRRGDVLARARGEAGRHLKLTEEMLKLDGVLPAVVWGSIGKVEPQFGKAHMIVVEYENLNVMGFALGEEDTALMVAQDPSVDPHALKARILEYIKTVKP